MDNEHRPHENKNQARTSGLVSWAMYDWANSAFITIIQSFIFSAYFTRRIAVSEDAGSAQWGLAVGSAGLLVAVSGPVLGAIADQGGRRKPWIFSFTVICVVLTALLWFMKPESSYVLPSLLLVGLAIICFEYASIFYNAMLPDLVSDEWTGRWSGWGWSLGYGGGLLCLVVALLAFVNHEHSWFVLNQDNAENIRAAFLLVAAWYLIFSLPLFIFTPDKKATGADWPSAVKKGLQQLYNSIREVRRYADIVRFLIARMVFVDGLATLFVFGGIYAATVFGMTEHEVLLFGIGLNVTAGAGAAVFAFLDDRLGAKLTILASLAGLILSSLLILTVTDRTMFWTFSLILGLFVGPCQASGRSYLARVAPPSLRTQMFGLFALSGKATAYLGPFLVGWVTGLTGSQRLGMSTVLIFFLGGFCLMLTVKNDRNPTVEE